LLEGSFGASSENDSTIKTSFTISKGPLLCVQSQDQPWCGADILKTLQKHESKMTVGRKDIATVNIS